MPERPPQNPRAQAAGRYGIIGAAATHIACGPVGANSVRPQSLALPQNPTGGYGIRPYDDPGICGCRHIPRAHTVRPYRALFRQSGLPCVMGDSPVSFADSPLYTRGPIPYRAISVGADACIRPPMLPPPVRAAASIGPNRYGSIVWGTGRHGRQQFYRNFSSASLAACCSAAFLLRPTASASFSPLRHTQTVNCLAWSGPVSPVTS